MIQPARTAETQPTMQTLVDFGTERRVLAAFLSGPERFACFDTLAYQDFQDFRLRCLFTAIRRLQLHETEVTTVTLLDELWRADDERGTHIADHCGAEFIGLLLLDAPGYSDGGLCIEHDVSWLKRLATRRAA